MPTYKGPYSPDFTESKVTGLDRDSYDPTNDVAALRAGRPTVANYDGCGINCSGTIDPQVKYGFAFDDNKSANWSQDKSDGGVGGFCGPAQNLCPPITNHQQRRRLNSDTPHKRCT